MKQNDDSGFYMFWGGAAFVMYTACFVGNLNATTNDDLLTRIVTPLGALLSGCLATLGLCVFCYGVRARTNKVD